MYTLYVQIKGRKVLSLPGESNLTSSEDYWKPEMLFTGLITSNSADVLFLFAEEWLLFLKPSLKGTETLTFQKCFWDSLQPDRICPSSKTYELFSKQ